MILVTGGNGFIGSKLVDKLLTEGYSVTTLSRQGSPSRKGLTVIKADVTDLNNLLGIGKNIDTVIHLAGLVSYSKSREELMMVNAVGTSNILGVCKNADRFILSSSVSVYGKIKGVADKDYIKKPMNNYGESKLAAEELVLNSDIKNVILRLAPVYGAGSPSWAKALKLLDKGFPIPNTKNLTHIVHVSDVVQAFMNAIKKGKGVYNIADKEPIKFLGFAENIVELLGRKPKIAPAWIVGLLARVGGMKTYMDVLTTNRNYDISRAREGLGYKPNAKFKESLAEMIEWYKENKKL